MVKELGKSLSNKYIYICIYVYVFEPRITKPEPSNLLFSRTCYSAGKSPVDSVFS